MLKKLVLCCLLWTTLVYAETPVLMVMGDSLSAAYGIASEQGWVHLLEQRLKEQGYSYQVVNASISGETTSGGHTRLSPLLTKHQPAIVIFELGANDGLRGLDLKIMQTNLTEMVKQAQQTGAKVLILGMRIPLNYGKTYAEQFKQIYQEVAKTCAVPLVPFFLTGVAGNRTLVQEDGLHPTASAQSKLLDTVWRELQPILSQSKL